MLNHDRRPLEALSEAPGHSVSGAQGTHSYFTVQIGKKKKHPASSATAALQAPEQHSELAKPSTSPGCRNGGSGQTMPACAP